MSMGGGFSNGGDMFRRQVEQMPENLGWYPGMDTSTPGGGAAPIKRTFGSGENYGQQGSYNTLAQDMRMNRTGPFQFGQQGMPFQYAPGREASGRPGYSGYTGQGPFQNQRGGMQNPPFQTSMPYGGGWQGSQGTPGFGVGGMPGRYQSQAGPGYGTGFGQGSMFGGPSGQDYRGGYRGYQSAGSMPYGGGSGMYGGYGGGGGGGYGGYGGYGQGGYGGGYQAQPQPYFGGGGQGGMFGNFGGFGGGGFGGFGGFGGGGRGGFGGGGYGGQGGQGGMFGGQALNARVQPAQRVDPYINRRSQYGGGGYGRARW